MSTAPNLIHEDPTALFLRGRGREQLDREDLEALNASVSGYRDVPPRKVITRANEEVRECSMLLSGIICRYMDDRAGHRQLVALHVPGDFVDLHAYPLGMLDHDVATIGAVRVAVWSHDAIGAAMHGRERLTRMLWSSTLLDAAMHREWIFRLGRLAAEGRVAHFMCELDVRLAMVGLNQDGRFALPLTQADIAEACGLTGVHVNRVLRLLRETGVLLVKGGTVTIMDRARLRAAAEFDPRYLHGDRA